VILPVLGPPSTGHAYSPHAVNQLKPATLAVRMAGCVTPRARWPRRASRAGRGQSTPFRLPKRRNNVAGLGDRKPPPRREGAPAAITARWPASGFQSGEFTSFHDEMCYVSGEHETWSSRFVEDSSRNRVFVVDIGAYRLKRGFFGGTRSPPRMPRGDPSRLGWRVRAVHHLRGLPGHGEPWQRADLFDRGSRGVLRARSVPDAGDS
jgi:hypothetical protein